MRLHRLRHAGLGLAAALALGAFAQGAQARVTAAQLSALRSHCRADFARFCVGVRPGGSDALLCLQANLSGLKPACHQVVRATLPWPVEEHQTAQAAPPPQPAAGQRHLADVPPPSSKRRLAEAAPPPRLPPLPPSREARQAEAAAPASDQDDAATAAPAAGDKKGTEAAQPPEATSQQADAAPPLPPLPSRSVQEAMRRHCRSDFNRLCAGLKPNSRDALACLQWNAKSLSPACLRIVDSTVEPKRQVIAAAPPPQAAPVARAERPAHEAAAEPPPPEASAEADAAPPPPPPRHTERNLPTPPPPRRADRDVPPPLPAAESRALRHACGRDLAALCPSLRPGTGRAAACLQHHARVLTPNCRRAMAAGMTEPRRSRRDRVTAVTHETRAPQTHRRSHRTLLTPSEVGRACGRDLARHCRSAKLGSGRDLACLTAHRRSLSNRCRATLRM